MESQLGRKTLGIIHAEYGRCGEKKISKAAAASVNFWVSHFCLIPTKQDERFRQIPQHSISIPEEIDSIWLKVSTEMRMVRVKRFSRLRSILTRNTERMEFSTSKEVTVAPTFEDMHLKENLLRGIYAYGYESPSAVQSRAIVQICKGRDTIAQAQSGTGKTATFSISILQVLETAVRETQGT